MKLPSVLVLVLALPAAAQVTTLLTESATGWAYLHPTDGTDPAVSGGDADFQSTWFDQPLGAYPGGSYDGPSFVSGATAPFHYGGVTGLAGGTVLATPASGDRYTSYFVRVVDGGVNGYHSLEVEALADDGLFVYLNGTLIARDGTTGSDTYTNLTGSAASESTYSTLTLIGTPVLNPGPNLLAVSNHNASTTSSDLGFGIRLRGIDASNPVPVTLVGETSSGWAYLQSLDGSNNDIDPAIGDPDFDATWLDQSIGSYTGSAPYDGPAFVTGTTAPFSYGGVSGISGGTSLTTPVSGTRQTAWFLKEIDGGADGYGNLSLTLLADDGALVYLNGHLIASKNMPAGAVDTWSLLSAAEGSETDFSPQPLLNDPVVGPGPNLLAVSVHQRSSTSSDLGLKLKLTGESGLPDLAFLLVEGITDTTATVHWVTGTAGNSTVRYGTSPGSYTTTVTVPGSVTTHEVALAGLVADTTYYFEAETTDGGGFTASGIGSFTSGPDPNDIYLTRGPYLQSASHDRITLRWETSQPGNSIVRYGTTPRSLDASVTVPGSVTDHTVTLTGLAADTTYHYQVETDNGGGGNGSSPADYDHFFQTSPPAGSPHPTRIWVIGDSGTANANAASVYNAFRSYNGQDHTDVWLMLGDNAYNSGTYAEFQNAVFDMYPELLRNTHLWSTLGNHEAYTAGGAPYLDLFHFPTGGECGGVASGTERYYSFDYGNIHFVCLDSQTNGNYNDPLGGEGMADWLQSDLEATTADWIIAYFHHGPYTKGSHDSDVEIQHIEMRANTLSILEDYGVDLILSGHSHCYERSHLINGHHGLSGTYTAGSHAVDPGNGSEVGSVDGSGNFVLTGADGAYQKPLAAGNAGQVSSIVGASGKLSAWDNGSTAVVNPAPHPVFVVNLRVLGSMVIDVDGHTLHAVYLDNAGTVRDDFTILKGSTLTATAPDDAMTEGGPDDTAGFLLTRTGATGLPLTVDYSVGGSASSGDYSPALSGTVTFAAGETSKPLDIGIASDDLAEGPETLLLTIVPRTGTITGTSAGRDTYFTAAPSGAGITLHDRSSQDWWFIHFGPGSLLAADWETDHDGDSLTALLEYALGGNPNVMDFGVAPTLVATATTIELHYTRNNALPDITYAVTGSTNLQSFSTTGVTDVLDGPANPTGLEARKAIYPIAGPFGGLRLEVTMP